MGGFSTLGGGVSKLSELLIDIDKDWSKYNIVNFGTDGIDLYGIVTAHADRHVSGGADAIPDRGIARSQLEYPTVDVTLAYLHFIGKASVVRRTWPNERGVCLLTTDSFADKAVEAACWDKFGEVVARWVDTQNHYFCYLNSEVAAADLLMTKYVAGTETELGYEAVNIAANTGHILKLSCSSTTLKAYRNDMVTPKISVTDTAHASGRFGELCHVSYGGGLTKWGILRAPSSPSPKTLAYFEVEVIGSGTSDDPFRAQMPEEIVVDWSLNPLAKKKYDILKAKGFTDDEIAVLTPEVLSVRRNLFALTHSSLIKTDRTTGKPVEYTAIVRVFDQPDRDPALRPVVSCIDALRAMPGVKELTRDEAIRRAKQIDPDLTDVDLLPISPSRPDFKTVLRDYITHREALGVKRELIDDKLMEKYLTEDKGWT